MLAALTASVIIITAGFDGEEKLGVNPKGGKSSAMFWVSGGLLRHQTLISRIVCWATIFLVAVL